MCGTVNPVSNVYCQECTARLVPMTAAPGDEGEKDDQQPITGISLPTIPLDEEEQDEEPPAESEEKSASEDWLDELRESADEAAEGAEERGDEKQIDEGQELLEPADIPDWLHEMGPVSEESQLSGRAEALSPDEDSDEEPPEEDSVAPTDLAEQQQDLLASEGVTPEKETRPAEDEASLEPAEFPDWLSDLKRQQGEISTRSGEEPPAVEEQPDEGQGAERPRADGLRADEPKLEELPEWLQETILPTAAPAPSSEPDEAESAGADSSDWLEEAPTSEAELAPREPAVAEAETERAASAESVGTPSWLEDTEGDKEEALPEAQSLASTEAPPEAFEPPEWLRGLMEGPAVEEETSPFASGMMLVDEELGKTPRRADIPDWLQNLRPSEVDHEEAPGGPLETEGLLKGLRDLIPASPGTEAPTTYEIESAAATSEASRARAELLQSLLGQPHARPKPDVKEEAADIGRLAERWLVAIVLLVSVLGMLLAPLMTGEALRLSQPVATSEATQLYEIVNGLDATDSILVAFDYGPPEADELDNVAQPVLGHLIESGGDISIVSTRPDGPPVAAALMSKVAGSSDQYTLLGYRPGAGTAVSQLLAVADEPPTLLLVLTSRPGPLLRWIEQAQARYGDELQVAAASSALLEPVTSPYLDANAGQLSAAIHGLRGAASYEALRGAQGEATQRLDTLAAGHVAIVALMITGAVFHGLGGIGRRKD
jgi:hypothetical protein